MSQKEFDKHFTPPYTPWQQRYCLAPGGDFFQSIREGKFTLNYHILSLIMTSVSQVMEFLLWRFKISSIFGQN